MGGVGEELAEGLQDDIEEDVGDVLVILGHYARKMEDERGDTKRIFPGDPLPLEKTLRHLNEKQRLSIKKLLRKSISSHLIQALNPMSRAEVYYYLGLSYEKGLFGIKRDDRKAFENYIVAAQLGSAVGTFRVAQCYEKGIGKARNIEKAVYFYRCAAKLGLIDAMHTYGVIVLFERMERDCDLKIGYFYLRLAAKKATYTYPYALYDLGRCHEKGKGPDIISPDDLYAFKLYLKGASLDCPNCQFRVGKCFENGEMGHEKDMRRSIEWYIKAADLGQSDAQTRLSALFLNGLDGVVEKNIKLGFRLGLKAATRENVFAAYLVSECYKQGIGVKKNALLALWWSRIAEEFGVNQGNPLVERIKIVIPDEDEGKEQFDFEDGMITGLIKAQ
ncbi:uncharacterized protein Eint_070450 [Encephalitozoon intestinalis ATCC 50506]|uniref:Uncharacterized protein n=1 Tax=Encephalitozoon intestinalis (strain ATCC 50506) TaxID=876142 RepID=E0S7X4_ENCIT|nr:uncharacterized protein Eint_070450 [Encephalitozoon intestinalis ATCC 50506]ADM11809.2 hypothetical protein Eint_070450 [Encephalitozoon intestinalis ATCC 50506]UTX45559.1 hypothetical protein GPK93_07g11220 [Encephalitozoon intestinalis]